MEVINIEKIVRISASPHEKLGFTGTIYFEENDDKTNFVFIKPSIVLILPNGELQSLNDFLTLAYNRAAKEVKLENQF